MESIIEGVPMICRPQFADQMMNTRYVEKIWGVGFELEGELERGRIEEAIRKLMEGREGADTTGNRTLPSAKGFAEYNFSGTRQTIYLPSAIEKTLDKKRHSANKVVCRVPRGWHSAKRCLPSAKGWALGKHPISEFSKNFKNSKQSLKIMRFGKMS